MQNDQYKHFLKKTRDTVAHWIEGPEIRKRFRVAMDDREKAWRRYKADDKAEYERVKAYNESPVGKATLKRFNEKQCAFLKDDWEYEGRLREWEQANWLYKRHEIDEHPGPKPKRKVKQPKPPKESVRTELKDPLGKFRWPLGRGQCTICDRYVLLGALHDGVTWEEGDLSEYICLDLLKPGTIVDALYWDSLKKNPNYEAFVEEARRYVEKDLIGQGLMGDKKQAIKKPTIAPVPVPIPIPVSIPGTGERKVGGEPTTPEHGSCDEDNQELCTHSPDFKWVRWYSREYIFNKNQATAVKLLWAAHEDSNKVGVHEVEIGKAIETNSGNYRLLQTFRQRRKVKRGYHPAWGKMIEHVGSRVHRLITPKPDNGKS